LGGDDGYEEPHGRQGLDALGKQGAGLLADVPLFSGLTKRQLRRVAELAQQVEFPAGAMVVTAGAPGGSAFFVIARGQATVVRNNKEIARLGPGRFFGELAILGGGRRNASVIAQSDLTTVRLSRDAFREVMSGEPGIAFHVMEVLAARIQALEGEAPSD
jgi:CRP/FNR family transcriptional regulator, cyclic AMP receptor protein